MTHHGFVFILLVSMNGLSMLPKVVEAGKLFPTVAAKGTLAGMFSDVASEMLATRENHATVTKASALEGLCGSRAITLVDAGGLSRDVIGNDHCRRVWRIC